MKTVPLENKIKELLTHAVEATHAWSAIMMVPDKKRGVLDSQTYVGLPDDWAHITNALDETTGNGRCYLHGKPVVIEGVSIEQPPGATTEHFMSTIAVVPIKQNNRVVATLEVIKDEPGALFSSKEVTQLVVIANKIAIAWT